MNMPAHYGRNDLSAWQISEFDTLAKRLEIDALSASNFGRRFRIDGRMSYSDMLEAVDGLTVTVVDAILPDDIAGVYDEETQLIVIDERMIDVQKRCTLVHELFHWMHADQCCNTVLSNRVENRTRRETAVLLISPVEYIAAERQYDGGIYQMACELNVTVQVLKDYQHMLECRHTTTTTSRSLPILTAQS